MPVKVNKLYIYIYIYICIYNLSYLQSAKAISLRKYEAFKNHSFIVMILFVTLCKLVCGFLKT